MSNYQKLQISVTYEDIVKGVRCSKVYCPVALAITRSLLPLSQTAEVYPDRTELYSSANYPYPTQRVEHEDIVKSFVDRFDAKQPVRPFEFELNVKVPQP